MVRRTAIEARNPTTRDRWPETTEEKELTTDTRTPAQTLITLKVRPPLTTMLLRRLLLLLHTPRSARTGSP